jgi:hypothetical protein
MGCVPVGSHGWSYAVRKHLANLYVGGELARFSAPHSQSMTINRDNMDGYKPSKLHWHEALDRTSVIMENFNDYVESHPVVLFDDQLGKKAKVITDLLYDLYQEIGHRSHNHSKTEDQS